MSDMRKALIRELLQESLVNSRRPIIQGIVDDVIMEVYAQTPKLKHVSRLLSVNEQRIGQAKARVMGRAAA